MPLTGEMKRNKRHEDVWEKSTVSTAVEFDDDFLADELVHVLEAGADGGGRLGREKAGAGG